MAPLLDRWIIKKALEDKELLYYLESSKNTCVNSNLYGLTLSDPELTDYVCNLLEKAELPPRSVCFEITETAAIANFDSTVKFIRRMKILGCDFALDDFGSGVSSFSYLKSLPVDFLKINGSLIKDLHINPINVAMVNSINQIAHVMNMKTFAEFVENKKTQEHKNTRKIDRARSRLAQGYYIHMQDPLSDVLKSLAK